MEGYEIRPVNAHDGGRNVVYTCEKEGTGAKIIRIAFLSDRSREDFLGEVEYIRYLFAHGGSVSDVVSSKKGNLLEEIAHHNHYYFVCVFEKAKGKLLAENNYRYREGAPITEYFYNCGKVLGKMHQLSNFGMVHFDYSDGNYMIDYGSGQITVFDFDNSCFCWYMYDLANVWTHGVGWIQFEQDVGKRRKFMEDYFETVLVGYRSETEIANSMLEKLPLFIQVILMEGIVDAFEVMLNNGEEPECDEELSYRIKCLEDDIPYMGFFHEIYSCEEPFEYEERNI